MKRPNTSPILRKSARRDNQEEGRDVPNSKDHNGRTPNASSPALLRKAFFVLSLTINLFFLLSFSNTANDHSIKKPLRTTATTVKVKPFPEMHGKGYDIWHPLTSTSAAPAAPAVIAPPEVWIDELEERYKWLDIITTPSGKKGNPRSPRQRAHSAYAEMLKYHVSGLVFGKEERRFDGWNKNAEPTPVDMNARKNGYDWAYLGDTMTGWERLDNVRTLLEDIESNNIKGHYIETGVWRGGSSIFARGMMRSLNHHQRGIGNSRLLRRKSFVCDSFKGLPPGDRNLTERDKGWDRHSYLRVSSDQVQHNFERAGLLDEGVVFVKGFFNDTMPQLKKGMMSSSSSSNNDVDTVHDPYFAIMRLDGDMYESTVDVLYNLYDRLSLGGYVIMDDWTGFPSKNACEDFFKVHGIQPNIIPIDAISAYWQKTEHIDKIQYWRYEQNKFQPTAT